MKGRKNLFHGEKVRQIINEKGLTGVEFARQIGIPRFMLSNYINGKRNPPRYRVQQIADGLRVPITEISDYNAEIAVPEVAKTFEDADALLTDVCRFVVAELSRRAQMTTQLNVAKQIGVSHPYVCNLISGKADVRGFPISALVKLCPQIINREALIGAKTEDDLPKTLEHIKLLVDRITDITTARMVERMLNGLVGVHSDAE